MQSALSTRQSQNERVLKYVPNLQRIEMELGWVKE